MSIYPNNRGFFRAESNERSILIEVLCFPGKDLFSRFPILTLQRTNSGSTSLSRNEGEGQEVYLPKKAGSPVAMETWIGVDASPELSCGSSINHSF
ncbi:hypothetical protein TNIN_218671 [Trichonephila inaurata madagascariensis]|uniref:Uncharacterized protein n=1 Tax=Trichonephila inaurata madagascariensis TaxID=2747483 RepID=A0A8X7CKY2_9ARAC|nr:hypothetical protein TNIN_218671 [Trichonephila inaurata madagascariensis]